MTKPDAVVKYLTPHPDDSRVAETSSLSAFKKISTRDEFQAAVLHRFTNSSATNLHRTFARIYATAEGKASLDQRILAHVENGKHVTFSDFPISYERVRPEIRDLIKTFSQITSIDDVEVLIMHDLQSPPNHDHPYPVLACSWVRDGLKWYNENGQALLLNEGNLMFLKPGFRHESPDITTPRISLVAKPLIP